MLTITTSLRKISRLNKRICIIQGGARAGKTYSILLLIIDYCLTYSNKRVAIFSFSYPHLRRGAINDFVAIMKELGLYNENHHDKTAHVYNFPNGSKIEFITADKSGNIQGTQYHITFVNEGRLINFDVFNQILLRSILKCYIDFNPTTRYYVHDLISRPDADFLKLTYKDNERCPKAIIDEMNQICELAKTSSYWANYKRVFVDGDIGGNIDQVFPDWKIIKEVPSEAKLVAIGVDFGFTNSQTAVVAIYYANNSYYIKELAYSTMMRTDKIAEVIKQYNCPVYCDEAEPRTIDELNSLLKSKRCRGVKYGLIESIDLISRQNIFVTANSSNILNEQMNLMYERDKYTGELTNNVIGTDHAIDAIRYGICGHLKFKRYGIYQKSF